MERMQIQHEREKDLEKLLKTLELSNFESKIKKLTTWYKEKTESKTHAGSIRSIRLMLRTCLKTIVEINDGAMIGLCESKKHLPIYIALFNAIHKWKIADK